VNGDQNKPAINAQLHPVNEDFVIITAGGRGERFGLATPKQFYLLKGMPVLMHTFLRFYEVNPKFRFILTLPGDLCDGWKKLCEVYNFNIAHELVEGGKHRFDSVKNALSCVPEDRLVGIHAAARPWVEGQVIEKGFSLARVMGNAVPVFQVNESIRWVDPAGNRSLKRDQVFLVQTPQVFLSNLIKNAYAQEYRPDFTDDASVLESAGEKINLFPGNKENRKITYFEDLLNSH